MNLFDIIGPVMIGPSSSHTAGAARIGKVALKILGEQAVKAEIGLAGSFAETYNGHGTDKALIAGIMGMESDDERIRCALELAKEQGLDYSFHKISLSGAHPNTACISLTGETGKTCSIQASSIGGGNIRVTQINGMEVSFTGQYHTLVVLHYDRPGTIAAVTNYIAGSDVNIGNFRLSRPKKGGEAVMTIEVDGGVSETMVEGMKLLPNVIQVVLIEAI